jgi:hypothetical protein
MGLEKEKIVRHWRTKNLKFRKVLRCYEQLEK